MCGCLAGPALDSKHQGMSQPPGGRYRATLQPGHSQNSAMAQEREKTAQENFACPWPWEEWLPNLALSRRKAYLKNPA